MQHKAVAEIADRDLNDLLPPPPSFDNPKWQSFCEESSQLLHTIYNDTCAQVVERRHIIEEIRAEVERLMVIRHRKARVHIFGSVLMSLDTPTSDVDLMLELPPLAATQHHFDDQLKETEAQLPEYLQAENMLYQLKRLIANLLPEIQRYEFS